MTRISRTLALTLALALVALVAGSSGQAASAATTSNQFGTLTVSKVTGRSDNGGTFAGQLNVKRFVEVNDKIKAVGVLKGELTRKNGKKQSVSDTVRLPVKFDKAATSAARTTSGPVGTSAVGCEILDLVLGPVDLNLLGLEIHLDRVHLNITAVPGAGNLLGNLLCAVVGLFDGPTGGPAGALTNLLNRILGLLG